MPGDLAETIRTVLGGHGRLPVPVQQLDEADDLYQAGMSSHASISVMLGLEDAFDVEFPDHMLTREVFASIASMKSAVGELLAS